MLAPLTYDSEALHEHDPVLGCQFVPVSLSRIRPTRPSLTDERSQTVNVANASDFRALKGRVDCSGG